MIVAPWGPDRAHFRFLAPRWARQPLSGAGAARVGGRLNRPGIAALYLSTELETAAAEYRQTEALLRPGVVATYLVSLRRVVDFSRGFELDRWDPAWRELDCDWRELAFVRDIEPPSWLLGDLAAEAGASGIAFPSRIRAGGVNLVVYVDALGTDDRVVVHDPRGDLSSVTSEA